MDQEMEAEDFFPEKMMSDAPQITAEGDITSIPTVASTGLDERGDASSKSGHGGESVEAEIMNGDGSAEMEAMETDEPQPTAEDAEMEQVGEIDEADTNMEEARQEAETAGDVGDQTGTSSEDTVNNSEQHLSKNDTQHVEDVATADLQHDIGQDVTSSDAQPDVEPRVSEENGHGETEQAGTGYDAQANNGQVDTENDTQVGENQTSEETGDVGQEISESHHGIEQDITRDTAEPIDRQNATGGDAPSEFVPDANVSIYEQDNSGHVAGDRIQDGNGHNVSSVLHQAENVNVGENIETETKDTNAEAIDTDFAADAPVIIEDADGSREGQGATGSEEKDIDKDTTDNFDAVQESMVNKVGYDNEVNENAENEIVDTELKDNEDDDILDLEEPLADTESAELENDKLEESRTVAKIAAQTAEETSASGYEDWKILEDSQTSVDFGEESAAADEDSNLLGETDETGKRKEEDISQIASETDDQKMDQPQERLDAENTASENMEPEAVNGENAGTDQEQSKTEEAEADKNIIEEEVVKIADSDEKKAEVVRVPDDIQVMQTEDYGITCGGITGEQASAEESDQHAMTTDENNAGPTAEEESFIQEERNAMDKAEDGLKENADTTERIDKAEASESFDTKDTSVKNKDNALVSGSISVEDRDDSANTAPDKDEENQMEVTCQTEEGKESVTEGLSESTADVTEEHSESTADDARQSGASPSAEVVSCSEKADTNEQQATPTTGSTEQSEVSGIQQSASPSAVADVKIKQEKMDSFDEEKTSDSASEGVQKIVGVTSAVGIEDKEVNSENNSHEKTGQSTDKVDVQNEVKIKQEKLAAASVKQEIKKKDEHAEGKKKVKEESKAAKDEDDDVIAIKEEKKPLPKPKPSKIQTCIVCGKVGKCKYNIVRNGDVKHLCDDVCFKKFRSSPSTYLKQAEAGSQNQSKPENQQAKTTAAAPSAPKPAQKETAFPSSLVYKTCTVCQLMNVRTSKPFLNWQGLDFCGEECLGKYQGSLSNNCSYCAGAIFPNNKAKFCCRVGNEVKHFCSANCNNDFLKRMKLCSFCNKDLAQSKDSFMAPVGDTFKDFCSQKCLQKFEDKNNQELEIVGIQKGQKAASAPKGNFQCAVCGKVGPVKHEFKLDSKLNRLCSDPCFSAFQYANKLTLNTCDNCGTNLNSENQAPQYVQFEGQQKRFCSFMCVNTFRNVNKKTVPCAWCGSKKSNFDMIERVDANNKYQLFCSLNCLSLYRVNLQATSNQAVVCDQCQKFVPAQYHLTMSDASVRNFCSYSCVMQFQAQFQTPAKQLGQQNSTAVGNRAQPQQQTTTRSGRVVTKAPKVAASQQQQAGRGRGSRKDADSFPIISNVVSLAPQGSQQQINIKSSTPVTVSNQQQGVKATTVTTGTRQQVQQQIIIQPPPPKVVKNKSLLCKPFTQTKATSCRPHTQIKEVQTEGKSTPDKYLIPVPVPVYCPTPLAMYSMPTPILIPIPVPVPVPVFIPTTKKSSNSILKQIKDIREKIPADPLEAELLMMAEAVAGKDEESSSSSEEEDAATEPATKEVVPTSTAASAGGELGEDMLQMALRMASEMSEEPVMDLETSLEPVAVNTEPPPQPKQVPVTPQVEEEEEYLPTSARSRRARGGKRSSRSTPRRNPKRQKVETPPSYREPSPSPPPPTAPPPDANFHLKYTYGVNAFKHWVIQKNAQIEQASKPSQGKNLKTFKTDILQCTADELNFALCLFVKEVRKPNGEEYAVDSIYYLCLGIQQYLFENGRIDNIFTDFYYERFTEGLNEILTRYEPKLNHAGQLVCRIEEEHLWESKQLGAHSPHVLLNSLVYFNTKYFMLKTSEDHLKLSFTHIMKHWKKTATGRGSGTGPNAGRSVYLRYYCPTPQNKDGQKKKKEEMPVYEQTENLDNPLRCPVKLYEFYLSKCPESIKNRNDTFYLVPERSCVPDSPVWYSTNTLGIDQMAKMLNRIRLVREIQEAHLHTQPIYI